MIKRIAQWLAFLAIAALATGCASHKPYDYTAYKQSRPRSLLVLPPLNESPEVAASYGMLSQVTMPLAEAGYYVLPVTLVDETFKQNGMSTASDIHGVAPAKLKEIFGADAALYVTVSKYGTRYSVISSDTVVSASAKMVDLKTGAVLWSGFATASNNEGNNNSGGGLVGLLVTAALKQIINSATDASHDMAGVTSQRLFSAGRNGGLLYGPYSPRYGTD
ncbi:hypothetical protein HNO92_003098 [Chromobacterium alkanivorans]|uniref:DUF799 domain-containing protein n=1 Tax=Chromobacterium TaxID=535 RepID=UPI00065440AD|nr:MULTISPECIES: DUF799 domain-containing protein [Chromobacterium]KMN76219.1 lipoprotein [Chromobacterium sp. LK11]MBN3006239.1 DUF799 domain-containing protein [Chromobacterium alkanivorans]MCS3805761.1 hypothetical protein [Chromobacterium alkanivorans]MCS3820009.1 hypothetical protein [Chromobacterium alkanivorans]MCS3874766.1 hypothetical protein [Chromobacterium alkanivorans]